LLATFLKETQTGDVRRRDHIRAFFADPDNPRHDHAKRVMESYEKEWLAGKPVLLAIMHMVGLFDRPASGDCLNALRAKPVIEGLTDEIVSLGDSEWHRAVTRLREVRLLLPRDPTAPDALDAHPLVREWFGERLRQTNESAWKAANGRLFEHLRDTTKEGKTPTLKDLAPLYQAIAHGCRAGRHGEVLKSIYMDRICRREADGELEFYSSKKLGALGSDLAATSWFFDKPYVTPVATLTPPNQSWVLMRAAYALRAQGRVTEALPAMRVVLRLDEDAQRWRNAASAASNLSQAELLAGEVAAAVATAKQSLAGADRSGDEFQMLSNRAIYGDALHAAGRRKAAVRAFADVEQQQKKRQPEYPLLYSAQGYLYCDLLLAGGGYAAARDRATQTVKWMKQQNWLLDIALDTLTLGRADLGLALAPSSTKQMSAAMRDDARTARARLDEAIDGLRRRDKSSPSPRSSRPRRIPPQHRRLGRRRTRSRRGRRNRRAGRNEAAPLRSCARTCTAVACADRSVRAAQWHVGEGQSAETCRAERRRNRDVEDRGREATQDRGGLHRDVRLSPARRGTGRIAGRVARREEIRRPAAAGVTLLLLPACGEKVGMRGRCRSPEHYLFGSTSPPRTLLSRSGSRRRPLTRRAPRADLSPRGGERWSFNTLLILLAQIAPKRDSAPAFASVGTHMRQRARRRAPEAKG
jgi:tetratricopeptide (TPR) repeat protein